jgi:CBS domain-containing protein
MPSAKDILSRKGFSIYVVPPTATVLEAVEQMNLHRCGGIMVMDQGKVRGIFTERDVLRRVVGQRRDPASTAVSEVMTKDLICCSPETDIDEISYIMLEKRVRHLPVCDQDGDLLGMISIGDVNAFHAHHQQATISYLSEYIYGRV